MSCRVVLSWMKGLGEPPLEPQTARLSLPRFTVFLSKSKVTTNLRHLHVKKKKKKQNNPPILPRPQNSAAFVRTPS